MEVDIFLSILGIIGTISGINIYRKVLKMKKWPRVSATLIRKGVKITDKAVSARSGFNYEVDLEYEYNFNQQQYSSNLFSPVTTVASQKDIQKQVDKIPDNFLAYVNPNKPKEAFYKTSSTIWGIIAMTFGIICLMALLIRIVS